MRWIRAIVLVFSTYTRIPMPQVKWDDDAMKLSIAFLPLVGVLIGVLAWGWLFICESAGISAVLFAAVTAVLPILVTGGIHMDGYCDTSDALASWQDKERRLEILKDPRIGAFALIRFGVYMLLNFALLYELYERGLANCIAWIFPLSRYHAAWSAVFLKNARKDGMLAAFTQQADRNMVIKILYITFSLLFGLGILWSSALYGGLAQRGLLDQPALMSLLTGVVLCIPVLIWYSRMTEKKFGGVTGDTTGFYLQVIELTLTAGLLMGGIAEKWL